MLMVGQSSLLNLCYAQRGPPSKSLPLSLSLFFPNAALPSKRRSLSPDFFLSGPTFTVPSIHLTRRHISNILRINCLCEYLSCKMASLFYISFAVVRRRRLLLCLTSSFATQANVGQHSLQQTAWKWRTFFTSNSYICNSWPDFSFLETLCSSFKRRITVYQRFYSFTFCD